MLKSPDLSPELKDFLRAHDPNSAKFFNGDILRQIRISTLRRDGAERKKWLSRLTPSQRTYISRLEALPQEFLDSLDALIPFAGLWPALQIGTFSRLSGLHCPEVGDMVY